MCVWGTPPLPADVTARSRVSARRSASAGTKSDDGAAVNEHGTWPWLRCITEAVKWFIQ